MHSGLLVLVRLVLCCGVFLTAGCTRTSDERITLTLSASSVGREAELLREQLARFEATHPGVRVELEETPDAADQRHQLYVQWLNARTRRPDVLQLDVIWTPEFAAAGWLMPLETAPAEEEFFEATLQANRYRGKLYALPWFVDVGMLYYRTDLLERPPQSLDELASVATAHAETAPVEHGLVWQNARYEGLVTVFLEVLGGFGGRLMDASGRPQLDSPEALRALGFMRDLLQSGAVPRQALGWQEEQTRFAFQNGRALFMRNWPYAARLLESDDSAVRGKFGVAPMPQSPGGTPTATLGGGQLGINQSTRHPEAAQALVRFLTAPRQMRERAERLGQLPSRPALFEDRSLGQVFGASPEALRGIVTHAEPRPPHPLYTEMSSELQVELHRALSGQAPAKAALERAQARLVKVLEKRGRAEAAARARPANPWLIFGGLLLVSGLGLWLLRARFRRKDGESDTGAFWMLAPALGVLCLVALGPLLATLWQSLFVIDLRMPDTASTVPSLRNYMELFRDPRLWGALLRTVFFVGVSVSLELTLGLVLALALRRATGGLGALRAAVILPWAIPTVVAGLVFRFLFEGSGSLANVALAATGILDAPLHWLTQEGSAWVPVILADVWKTTPFVTLLLLAALSGIDPRLYEAAEVDGAYRWRQFLHVTMPLLKPALLVVLLFRCLDALRVFDLIYVLTQGGPGTATEPLALYTFTTLFSHLEFGKGAALSVIIVGLAGLMSLLFVGLLGRERTR